jgi:predicted neutral ceramidase superfamily lipid hydrolase
MRIRLVPVRIAAGLGCNLRQEIYNLESLAGVLAQLVERLNGIEEVTGSNPVGSSLSVLLISSQLSTAVSRAQSKTRNLQVAPGNKRVTFAEWRAMQLLLILSA